MDKLKFYCSIHIGGYICAVCQCGFEMLEIFSFVFVHLKKK